MNRQTGHNLTPPTATSYFLTVVTTQYKEKLSLRTSRELRTVARAIDLIAQGQAPKGADVLSQRFKALEMSVADQSWSRAQHLELLPSEGATLVDKDDEMMTTKEQATELRLKQGLAGWRPSYREESRSDEKGKGRGKGKGKKGK